MKMRILRLGLEKKVNLLKLSEDSIAIHLK